MLCWIVQKHVNSVVNMRDKELISMCQVESFFSWTIKDRETVDQFVTFRAKVKYLIEKSTNQELPYENSQSSLVSPTQWF